VPKQKSKGEAYPPRSEVSCSAQQAHQMIKAKPDTPLAELLIGLRRDGWRKQRGLCRCRSHPVGGRLTTRRPEYRNQAGDRIRKVITILSLVGASTEFRFISLFHVKNFCSRMVITSAQISRAAC
jgi:hypothetical protein